MYRDERIKELKNKISLIKDYRNMIELGIIYNDSCEYTLAEKYFKMAREYNFEEGSLELGKFYLTWKQPNLAENCFKELADRGNDEFQNYLGNTYKMQLNLELAKKYYRLSMEQGNKKAIYNLGYLYFDLEDDFDSALELLETLDRTDDVQLSITLAKIYHKKKELEKCEKTLKAVESDSLASYLLAELYTEMEKFDLAEKYFILSAEKDDIDSQKKLYKLYTEQGKSKLAKKYLRLLAKNGDLKAIFLIAQDCIDNEEYAEAINYYKILENKELDFYTYYDKKERINYNLCVAYLKTNNEEGAKKYLEKLKEYSNYSHLFKIAEIYKEKNNLEKTIEFLLLLEKELNKSVEVESVAELYWEVHLPLGKIYYDMEKFDLAEKYLKLALKFKEDTESFYLLGSIYEKQNNFGLAIKYYVEADVPEADERISAIEYKLKLLAIKL
ncbi:tetratricopeptide repeat protein [uncultured Fusobacterium sp.]|uniref:tetratricopeptide repeat protein n=1 Tax=uncultured Fusobacterium sp. TaxID=159267 RepID=UPI0015A7237D|nr:tetratricopeptide repeat protein [uncultured Fusobacterium sp.]